MNKVAQNDISTEVISLPEIAVLKNGFVLDPNLDMWKVPDTSQIGYFNFGPLKYYCSDELLLSLKKVLVWYLSDKSVSHTSNMFRRFKELLEFIAKGRTPISSISHIDIANYKGSLPKKRLWYVGSMSGFLQKWHELGYPGVGSDVYALLEQSRHKGNEKGVAVLTMDPEKGPFTEIELQTIHQAVNGAFAKGDIGSREFSLVWLFMATGTRPVQIVDRETRSRMMSGIRGKNTKAELLVRKALFARGFRYRLHDSRLPGKPDIIFPRLRAVVLIHGCFWHGHGCHLFRQPASNVEFWQNKIARNIEVDRRNQDGLTGLGWRVLTVWECVFRGRERRPTDEVIDRIAKWLSEGTDSIELVPQSFQERTES